MQTFETMGIKDLTGMNVDDVKALAVVVATKVVVGLLVLLVAYILGRVASSAAVATLGRTDRGGTPGPIVRKGITLTALSVGLVMALDQAGIDVAASSPVPGSRASPSASAPRAWSRTSSRASSCWWRTWCAWATSSRSTGARARSRRSGCA
ncbi:MAG: hypothetical protein R3F59_36850 [Myxococcota bacterium]